MTGREGVTGSDRPGGSEGEEYDPAQDPDSDPQMLDPSADDGSEGGTGPGGTVADDEGPPA